MQISRLFSFGFLLAAALVAAGCGGDKDKDKAKDDKGGDAKKPSEKLVGKWSLDNEATIKHAESQAKTDEEKQQFEFTKGFLAEMKMQMEFKADGKLAATMSMMGQEDKTKEATYTVKTEDPLVITATMEEEPEEMHITFVDDDTIEVVVPNDPGRGAMVMTRVK